MTLNDEFLSIRKNWCRVLLKDTTFHYSSILNSTKKVNEAIAREKQIKGWLRKKKIELIEISNPEWKDLSSEWYEKKDSSLRSE